MAIDKLSPKPKAQPAKPGRPGKRFSAVVRSLLGGIVLAAIVLFNPAGASAQNLVELGLLDCVVSRGSGFIFGSTKDLRCEFRRADGLLEPYFGAIKKFGLDIGKTESSIIRWVVLAPTIQVGPGALAGDYVGVSAEATVGVGLGANALLGGFEGSVALQPFSIQTQQGLNFALGITELELRFLQ